MPYSYTITEFSLVQRSTTRKGYYWPYETRIWFKQNWNMPLSCCFFVHLGVDNLICDVLYVKYSLVLNYAEDCKNRKAFCKDGTFCDIFNKCSKFYSLSFFPQLDIIIHARLFSALFQAFFFFTYSNIYWYMLPTVD